MTTKPISAVTRINKLLKAAGYEMRLVRGRGYYYLVDTGEQCVAAGMPSSSIYVCWLEPKDFHFAKYQVNCLLQDAGLNRI